MKKWIVTISAAFSTLDLFWKDRIEKRPDSAKEEEMFGGKIRIRKVHNYGFALGTLSGEDRLVKGGSLGAGILLLIYYMKLLFSKKGKWKFAGTSLMLSGAVSNLYDRLKRGYVVDYIGFEAADPQIRKITFNLGDFCLMGGAAVVAAAAATAEISGKLFPVFLNFLLQRFRQCGRTGLIGQEFIQLGLSLYAPDRHHMIKLRLIHKRIGTGGIVDQSSGQSFHGNEAHICFPAHFYDLQIRFRRKIGERELHRFIKAGFDGFFCHSDPVVRDADMPDLSFLFCLLGCLVKPGSISWLRTEGRIVELVNINIICFQHSKTFFQVLFQIFSGLCRCFGTDDQFFADIGKRRSQLFFTVRISPCRVKIVDALIECLLQQINCIFFTDPLDRERTKTVLADFNPCFS